MLNTPDVTGIVLAGGKSTRMGTDKAFLKLNGKPFISHILETVQEFTNEVYIISDNQKLDGMGTHRFPDLIPGLGPIGGIHTGLFHSKTTYNLIVACDTPFLSKETITQLILGMDKEHDVFVVQCEDVVMPLIGIYQKSCLPHFNKAMERKQFGLKKALAGLHTKTISLPKSHAKSVLNINTKLDLKNIRDDLSIP